MVQKRSKLIKLSWKIALTLLLFFHGLIASSQFNQLVNDSIYSTILQEQMYLLIYVPAELIERKDTSIH